MCVFRVRILMHGTVSIYLLTYLAYLKYAERCTYNVHTTGLNSTLNYLCALGDLLDVIVDYTRSRYSFVKHITECITWTLRVGVVAEIKTQRNI